MNFKTKLKNIIKKNNSLVCVGLDPELHKIPGHLKGESEPFFIFNKSIIDATYDLAAAFKLNIAFYEAYGILGLTQLKATLEYLRDTYPEIPLVLDAKRGDIGNTAKMYARSMYDYWQADATTVYPHLGLDSMLPFLAHKDKLTILLIKTSNPDSKMFQDLNVGGEPFYLKVAKVAAKWKYTNIGLMVGATYPKELATVRDLFPNSVFLSPGLGAQAGSLKAAVRAGIDKNGGGIMFNASRTIIYASPGEDFAQKARESAIKLRDEINKYRS